MMTLIHDGEVYYGNQCRACGAPAQFRWRDDYGDDRCCLGSCRESWPAFKDVKSAAAFYNGVELPMKDEKIERPQFWMLYLENECAPTFIHRSRESAETEAKRLLLEDRDRKVFILKAVALMTAEEPVIKTEKLAKLVSVDDHIRTF